MKLHKKMPCVECYSQGTTVWSNLIWKTHDKNDLIVHNVPTYVCPVCGNEYFELKSLIVYDQQVQAAYDYGITEITLFYPDIEYYDD